MSKKYRIKETFSNGVSVYYPQYKKFFFWRNYTEYDSIHKCAVWRHSKEAVVTLLERRIEEDKRDEEKSKLPKGTRYHEIK